MELSLTEAVGLPEYVDQEFVNNGAKMLIEKLKANRAPDYEIYRAEMEMTGGKCRYCGASWVRESYENRFGKFEYFKPECQCLNNCL